MPADQGKHFQLHANYTPPHPSYPSLPPVLVLSCFHSLECELYLPCPFKTPFERLFQSPLRYTGLLPTHVYRAPYEERTHRVLHLSPRLMTQSSSRTRALLTLEQNTCQYLLTLPDWWPCLMCLLVTCWVSQLQMKLDKLILFLQDFFCILWSLQNPHPLYFSF